MMSTIYTNPDPQGLWLGKPVPRYTSYPPAPQFHTGVTARDYANTLKNLPTCAPVSLYIHIPFCRSLCLYCGCNTMITNRASRMEPYLLALKQEIRLVSGLTGKRRVQSLHFGGGTPNTMSADSMRDLFAYVRSVFDFESVREIAMEIDPRVTTEEQTKILAECGVTRVSLGVQDFDADVQAAIHRIQPYEQVAEVCGWLRDAGIHHINFDLIYGLPKQTPQTVEETVRLACTLHPDRMALFSYAHVPQIKKHQMALEEFGIPDSRQRLVLDIVARSVLLEEHYEPLGIDHFVLPNDTMMQAWRAGRLHRGFQGYTEENCSTLLGFGASSIIQTPDGYFQNDHDERTYQSVVRSNKLPVKRGFLLSADDRVRRAIIEHLMCYFSCDVAAVCDKFNYSVTHFESVFDQMAPYEKAGIVIRDGFSFCLTTPHRMAIRVICSLFDAYQGTSATLSSRTA